MIEQKNKLELREQAISQVRAEAAAASAPIPVAPTPAPAPAPAAPAPTVPTDEEILAETMRLTSLASGMQD